MDEKKLKILTQFELCGRNNMKEDYSWNKSAIEYENLYLDIIDN